MAPTAPAAPPARTALLGRLATGLEAPVTYVGVLARVHYRPRLLWPWHRLLQALGLGVARRARDVPCRWTLLPARGGAVRSQRRVGAGRPVVLRETLRPGRAEGLLVSRRLGVAELAWRLGRPGADTVTLELVGVAWKLGPLRIPMPRFAWVGVRLVERRAEVDGQEGIDVVWTVEDPWLGTVLEAAGTLAPEAAVSRGPRTSSGPADGRTGR